VAALATMAMVKRQLQRLGDGKLPKAGQNALFTLLRDLFRTKLLTVRYKAWLAGLPKA
jgi:hypothetical protein